LARPEFLKAIRGLESFSLRSHVMLIAYYLRRKGQSDFLVGDIETEFQESALPIPDNSLEATLDELSRGTRGPLVKVAQGRFSLSADGLEEVEDLLRQIGGLQAALDDLQHLVGVLAPEADDRLLPEVKLCILAGARRAIVVMMWLLAVDHLQRFVIAHKLTEFNAAMLARTEYRNTSPIGGQDDFSELRKEKHFVELLGSARIVSHDMKKLLEEKLDFRNTCAHPNTIFVSDTKVVSFVEDLVHNVILRLRL